MTQRTVTSQAEFDAAVADGVSVIDIRSERGVWIEVAFDSASVRAFDSASVRASGSASVRASDSASVRAFDSASVRASGSASVRAFDSASVRAYGSASVRAFDSASVNAYGSASVSAYDSASVSASGSASVRAYDSVSVSAYDSASVRASKFVAVHLHSKRATCEGGVLIDVSDLDQADAATWAENHGAETDGPTHLLVYKAVNQRLASGQGFTYPIGETVTAPDWEMTDACGAGLHFGPAPAHAEAYHNSPDKPRFLACRIPVADAIGITSGGTAKIKSRSCEVLFEVDIHGRRTAKAGA